MARFPGLRRFFRLDRGIPDVEPSVEAEIEFHLEMTARELEAGGMSPEKARWEAERRFGDQQRARATMAALDRGRVGRERRLEWGSNVILDLRYALRGLRLKPGFTLAVVLTLGLGIGANATMFGIVDRLLFRAPEYLLQPDQVNRVYLMRTFDGIERPTSNMSYTRYLDFIKSGSVFSNAAAFYEMPLAIGLGENAREMAVQSVSASFWSMFSARPVIGRFFSAEEDQPPAGSAVAVLGYGYWLTAFGGRSSAVGSHLRIGSNSYTIIGVAPRGFSGVSMAPPVAFVPITAIGGGEGPSDTRRDYWTTYHWSWMEMLVRRKPGISVESANAELTSAYLRSYANQRALQPGTRPAEEARPRAVAANVLRERGPMQGQDSKVATWLIGVAVIVLIIACANVGNLLLARAFGRRREIAVRLALGISRARLLGQLFIESALLALLSAGAALALAQWGGGILRAVLLPDVAGRNAFADPRVLGFTAVAALGTALLTWLAPALQVGRSDIATSLKAGVREGTHQRSRTRVILLVLQGALSVVLLVGAGLFVRSLHNVRAVPLGYEPERVLYVEPQMRDVQLSKPEKAQLQRRLLEQAIASPVVEHASRVVAVPFWSTTSEDLFVPGIDSVQRLGEFDLQAVTGDYFATIGTRILRGRGIEDADRAASPRVMVVSQAMAKALWPGRDALGQCVKVGADTVPCSTVVGIAEDIKTGSLSNDPGLNYYLPIDQYAPDFGGLFVRTRGDASTNAAAVRRTLQPAMPGTSYVTVTPFQEILAPNIRSWELGATMFTVFGLLALLVATVGLYSVVAYGVAQRTHELGIRVALGARSPDVIRLVLGQALRLALIGVVIGTVVALLTGRWVAPLLFGTSPRDPAIYLVVAGGLLLVSAVAGVIPALRAARVNPIVALRSD